MLSVFFFSLITNFIYYCAGHSTESYNNKDNEIDLAIKSLIKGTIILSLAALTINFFFPLSKIINSIIYLMVILFYLGKKKFTINFNAIKLILFSTILTTGLLLYTNINRPDAGLYHLPYISILNNEKIILGLSNLHFRFGLTSIIQYLSALNNNFLFNDVGILIPLASLASFFIIYFHHEVIKFYNSEIKINENYFFCFFVLIYIFYKINRYSEFGNDAIAHLGYFYLISYFLKLNLQNISFKQFNYIFLISVFIFMNKNTMIFLLFLPIILFFLAKDKINIFKKSFFSLASIFLIFWVLKNSLITGCIVYPLKETCFNFLWSNQILTNEVSVLAEAWSKGWSDSKLYISQSEFLNNFNWFDTWKSVHGKIFINKILIYLLISSLFFITFLGKKNKNFEIDIKKIFIIFLVSLVGTFFFLLKFPLYRYGYSFLISIIILIFLIIFKDFVNHNKIKKNFKYLFLISIIVFSTKQIVRIFDKFEGFDKLNVLPSLYVLNDKKVTYEKRIIKGDFFYFFADAECMYAKPPCTNIDVNDININNKFGYKIIYSFN